MDSHTKAVAVERVRRLCDELERIAPDDVAEAVAEVRRSVGEPLRVAVVGRVKAGKSTLVNALLGAKVAATNATECTRIVTWYRFGISAPTELVLRDGTVLTLPVTGRVPDEPPVPVEQISHAVVYLQERALQELTLIDTPGLETSTAQNEEATRRAILGAGTASVADAIVYVFKRAEHGDDLAFIREFHEASGGEDGAGEAVGVLSGADLFGAGPWGADDPLASARAYALDMAERHGALLSAVVPFAGRMAEASRTGEVRESDARVLAQLGALDELDLQDLETAPFDIDGVDEASLDRVLQRLRGYPLRHGRQVASDGAAALSRWLLERSGYAGLEAELRLRYVGLSAQLKVRQSLIRLREAARRSRHRTALDEAIETARIDPALHVLRELEAYELLVERSPGNPLIAMLERLLVAADDRARLGLAPAADAEQVSARARKRASEEVARAAHAGDSADYNAHLVLAQSYRLLAQRHAS